MSQKHTVLVLDDDSGVRRALSRFLEGRGYTVLLAEDLAEAFVVVSERRPDVAIFDYMLPDGTALELMARLKPVEPDLPIIILTGHGTIELAVRAIKEGAEHFLTKPVEMAALAVVIKRVLENSFNRKKQVASLRRVRVKPDPFLGVSAEIKELREQAEKLVTVDSPMLILGETGAGKGLLARWFHDNGPRRSHAFVDLNCSSLSRDFLESELFGHEKGAFTGAMSAKMGLIEVAHRGTLFLDEIADMDGKVQPKLLKALEELRFRRLGDVRERVVDVRLIAATHQDVAQLVQEKLFRADLYYRISALPIRIPPLRERVEDIPILARRLLDAFHLDRGGKEIHLTEEACRKLMAYSWPGNIRELRNMLERALLMSDGPELDARDFNFEGAQPISGPTGSMGMTLKELERAHIEQILERVEGRVAEAAERLGISRSALYHKIKTLGIGVSES